MHSPLYSHQPPGDHPTPGQDVSKASRFYFFWVLVWLVIANGVASLIDFDWTQDIAAYSETLESQTDDVLDTIKGGWYQYLVFPLREHLGDTERTLAALKAIILSLMFFSQRKSFRGHTGCLLFLAVLLLTPALAKNMTEYLRQGTAFGLLMLGLSFTWWIAIPLTVLALFTHPATILPIGAVGAAWIVSKIRDRKLARPTVVLPVFLAGAAIVCGMFGGGLIRSLAFEEAQEYLSGSRSNFLALLYLAFFAAYTGIQYTAFRSRSHLPVFIMFLVITASYSVILNFGRTLSIVLPLHLAAAMTLPTTRARNIDLLAVFIAGTAFIFAGG